MNANKIIGLIILLVVIAGAVTLAMSQSEQTQTAKDSNTEAMMEGEVMMEKNLDGAMMESDDAMMKDDSMMMEDGAMEAKDGDAMESAAGSYQAYSADKLALANEGDVVLFFKASWCPSCRTLDSDIRKNLDSIPAGVTILEVDYDSSTALKQKYGVTTQHTLVQVNSDGSLVKKWSGGNTLNATLAQII